MSPSDNSFYEKGPLTSTFVVEVDGDPIGRFTQVDGLEMEIEVESIDEGGQNDFSHKLPGRLKWPNIKLTRGVTQSDNLVEWMRQSAGEDFDGNKNKLTRSTVGIVMLSSSGRPLREWQVEGAFPVSWKGPSFSASDDDVLTEELEIAHHGFRAESF
ncbi:MAG TPA: phage tail protein [Acidimicrobiales bacterium]|nr:phage tail protein [Acidimicrobiales bacterium]